MDRSPARRLVAALIAVPLVCTLTGCGSPSDSPTVPPLFKSEIDQALANSQPNDFERHVLSDYVITDEELAQAVDLYTQCMADRGWIYVQGEHGTGTYTAAMGSGNEDKTGEVDGIQCQVGTVGIIEPIYWEMKDNPQGLTNAQLIRACFEVHGIPDGSEMNDDEFQQMIDDVTYHPSTPQGKVCFYDPTGTAGVTVESAEEFDADKGVEPPPSTCTYPPGYKPGDVVLC